MKRGLIITAVLLVILLASLISAQIPRKLSVEGRLLDSSNNPKTGIFTFNFSIFESSTGGVQIYAELQNITTSVGLFDAVMGNRTALDIPFDKPYFLEISVSSDLNNPGAAEILTPRRPITSAAYVLNAENATTNLRVTQDLEVGRNATIAGNLTVLGNATFGTSSVFIDGTNSKVGIGTTNPQARLHIFDSADSTIFIDSNTAVGITVGGGTATAASIGIRGSQGAIVDFSNNAASANWAIGLVDATVCIKLAGNN